MLYHTATTPPRRLPKRHRMPDGFTRTKLHEMTDANLAKLGYFRTPDAPDFDPDHENLEWGGKQWVVTRKSDADLLAHLRKTRLRQESRRIEIRGKRLSMYEADRNKLLLTIIAVKTGILTAPVEVDFQTGPEPVNAARLNAIAKKVNRHLQACLRAERTVAANISTTPDVRAAFMTEYKALMA